MSEWLYGRQAVREMLRAGRRTTKTILLAKGTQRGGIVDEIITLARARHCPVGESDRRQLDRLAGHANHQGLVADVSEFPYSTLDELLQPGRADLVPLLLCLDHVQDPQNVGTLLRTAEAVGVQGVVIPERRAAGITPAASNASAGAVEHLRVAQVVNLARALADLKQAGVWIAGLEATAAAVPYDRADLSGPLALVVGSEGQGLSRLIRESCDWLVSLPMVGQIESLNAAVAGSVVLYAALRARPADRV